jgi:hypothetical protein
MLRLQLPARRQLEYGGDVSSRGLALTLRGRF